MSYKHINLTIISLMLVGLATLSSTAFAQGDDIIDVAISDGRFTTLITALQTAELVDTLREDGPFTVFAPTDKAFAELPDGVLEVLLDNPEQLKKLLLYHVVPGKIEAAEVMELSSAKTAFGEAVTINVDGDEVNINGANVVIPDIEATNGVIHIINAVLIPQTDGSEAEEVMAEESMAQEASMDNSMAEETMAETEETAMDDKATMTDDQAETPATEGAEMPASGGDVPFVVYTIFALLVAGLALIGGGVAVRYRFAAKS